MTFRKALNELKKIANADNEDYFHLSYRIECANGREEVVINAYINGYSHTKGYRTFEAALEEMSEQINPTKKNQTLPSEAKVKA